MAKDSRKNTYTNSIRRSLFGGLSLTLCLNLLLYIGHLIIARKLSREDYATFTVVVSFISLMALFADLGLLMLFVRKFAEAGEYVNKGKTERRGELLGSMLLLRIGLTVIVSGIVVIIAPVLGYPPTTQHLMAIMLLTLFFSSRLMVVRSVGEAFLRARNKFHLVALFSTIDAAAFLLAIFFYSKSSLTLETTVWIYSLCHLPGFILLCWYLLSHIREIGFRITVRFKVLWSMIREGVPLILSTTFFTIYNFSDPLLLDKLSTPYQVSAYGASLRIFSAIVFLPMVFSAVVGPRVTQAFVRKNLSELHSIVGKSLQVLLIAGIAIALSLTCAPNLVVRLLFGGDKYSDVSTIVTLFGWLFIPMSFGTFLGEMAIAEDKAWLFTVYMGICMVVSVGSDFILIPMFGAEGAAIARAAAVTLGAIVLLILSGRIQSFDRRKFSRFSLRISFALGIGLLSFFICHSLLNLQEPIVLLITLCCFATASIIFKAISLADILSVFKKSAPGLSEVASGFGGDI